MFRTEPAMTDFLLLPGFMCDEHLWDDIAEDLSRRGRLHFGDLTRDNTFEAMADRVLAVAPETFVLIGFSMGGFVAREIALRAPDRVEALVLINTSARGDDAEQRKRKAGMVNMAKAQRFRGLSRQSVASSVRPDRAGEEALLKRIFDMADRIGQEGFVNQLGVVRDDGHARLGEIGCPTLVVWCRDDLLRSLEESRELADGIPGARLEIVENCGHMLPLEDPAALMRVLGDWLDTL